MLPDATNTRPETQRLIAESVLTEIELGLTFLDAADATEDNRHAQKSISRAITALRTADRFLSTIQPSAINLNSIQQRREQLAQRLRASVGLVRSRVR